MYELSAAGGIIERWEKEEELDEKEALDEKEEDIRTVI